MTWASSTVGNKGCIVEMMKRKNSFLIVDSDSVADAHTRYSEWL